MDLTEEFERERPRLTRIATRVLGDPAEAEDAVQQAWLRLARADVSAVDNLPGWLTTVVTRVCLDRLKAAVPAPGEPLDRPGVDPDPADEAVLADSVGSALHLVLDRLTPAERVALVLHDSFGVDFAAIAGILDCTPAAARKHASRARSKVRGPAGASSGASPGYQGTADWRVVDAFLAAARDGEFSRLLELLAPDVVVAGDPVAVGLGTPARIEGRDAVAEFFNGAAAAALPVFVHDRPGAAWFDRGVARVAFDFRVTGGMVTRIDFRARPEALETIDRRRDGDRR
ncbi:MULTISPECIES: sigma-70 family RNA polymerase sigma factor [unclassified Dietzia]|uniref:sigma-70 family RNA polymerase sigma factor n=1 Tax=unclassified Dietzia TaxID=2617939 RepID=UPI000D22B1AA|nr:MULTISPECIES: sigma-70 family RNA polymerase sigma factor [unclassified Dietzia]AVZ38562.1 RNA polymerase subunit sigma-70 [Dietzia sp. JS16-p6b]MBB1023813.1 sigma-70 family RNA polymerase sigma factor [Dietzia sp. DQ12-76]MBB1028851.1 sigma-70 family RNA polymerase sigma factor [Dietzia sp. DQ11-38-2]QGW23632.1 putative RNA polymerase ECF-type sigma factor [Dietzia sp. DQ12-45-1b]